MSGYTNSGFRLSGLAPGKKMLLAAELITLLSLIAYSNSFTAGFHIDDFHQIVRNQHVRDLGNVPRFFYTRGLGSYWSQYGDSNWYRPVTQASFAVNYAISGYRVWSYHVFNLTIHIMNAMLVYILLVKFLDKQGSNNPFAVPLTASLLFALHPVQTQAVTYISGRAALLAVFFGLLSFLSFVRFRESKEGEGYHYGVAALVLFYLSILSKETGSVMICMFLLYDMIFTFSVIKGFGRMARAALFNLYSVILFIFYLYSRILLQGRITEAVKPYTVPEYMMSQSKAMLLYLRLMFLPMNQNADYGLAPTRSVDILVLTGALIVIASVFLLYRFRAKKEAAAFWGIWFFIAFLPESSIVPVKDIAVEHRLYLPSIGLIAFTALLLSGRGQYFQSLKKTSVLLVLAVFTVLTLNRNSVWADDYTLWSDVAKKSPGSVMARTNLGRALLNKKQYNDAITELSGTLTLPSVTPKDRYLIHNNMGQCYLGLGMNDKAAEEFRAAIRINPGIAEAYNNLGLSYYLTGRYDDAVRTFSRAVEIEPTFDMAHINLALSYTMLGRHKDALKEMVAAERNNPYDFSIHYKLAFIYKNNSMPDDAVREAKLSLALAGNIEEDKAARALVAGLNNSGETRLH